MPQSRAPVQRRAVRTARRTIGAGTPSDARLAVETLNRVEPELPERERRRIAALLEQLRLEVNAAAARPQ